MVEPATLHQNEGSFRVLDPIFSRAMVSDDCRCSVLSISMGGPILTSYFPFCMSQKTQRHARPVRKRVLNACCVFYALTKKETCNFGISSHMHHGICRMRAWDKHPPPDCKLLVQTPDPIKSQRLDPLFLMVSGASATPSVGKVSKQEPLA